MDTVKPNIAFSYSDIDKESIPINEIILLKINLEGVNDNNGSGVNRVLLIFDGMEYNHSWEEIVLLNYMVELPIENDGELDIIVYDNAGNSNSIDPMWITVPGKGFWDAVWELRYDLTLPAIVLFCFFMFRYIEKKMEKGRKVKRGKLTKREIENRYPDFSKESPKDPKAWLGAGIAFNRLGKRRRGIRYIKKAAKLNTKNAKIDFAGGEALLRKATGQIGVIDRIVGESQEKLLRDAIALFDKAIDNS